MKLERTHDMGLVKSILAHPKIFPHIGEDGIDEPAPQDLDALHWMLVRDEEPAGVFLVHPFRAYCYEVHTCLLPRIWGAGANRAAQLLIAFVFNDLGAKKLITHVPAYNRPALRFAKATGMQVEGINRASFFKHGVMQDQIQLGITIKEWK
jgi:RimJ/RimL family protein N-acetyltransferase